MPVTRSLAKSSSSSTLAASAQPSDPHTVKGETPIGPLFSSLDDLQDDTLLRGRDAKLLRDATTSAITQVWNDTCATAALLSRKINEGNASLKEKLNESFAAVGQRLDSLPAVAMIQPDSQAPRVIARPNRGRDFSGQAPASVDPPRRSQPISYSRSSSQSSRLPPARPRAATESRCFNCNGFGHFASVCPSAKRTRAFSSWTPPRSFDAPQAPRRDRFRGPPSPRAPQANVLSYGPATANADADARVAQLTASLNNSQVQLRNSQARIAALLDRNQELSQFSGDQPSSSKASVFFFFHPRRALLILPVAFGGASNAWLCPSENPATLFFVPDHQNCSELLPNHTTHLRRISLHIYRPNTQVYSSPASLCKIIRHSVTFSVNFFGARREHHTETHLPVSVEECKQMVFHHRCLHGELLETSGVWRTRNQLEFNFPSAPFGCCVDHSVTVTNCYSYTTSVHAKHGDKTPQTPVGDLSACTYKEGTCTLSDGSVLIWSPSSEEQCAYTLVSKMSGHMMGTVWLSDDNEFALSWNDRSPVLSDCTKQLTVTDQGYAIHISRRYSRSAPNNVGLVTSNQLSAQLLAVEGATYISVAALFRNALRTLCERTNVLGTSLHTALRSHPTSTMRALLGRRDISASYLGHGYIQIRRCVSLPASSLTLLPFNDTCYDLPQVQLHLPSGSRLQAFIDPITGVIRRHASVIDCADSNVFVFPSPDGLRAFSPSSGAWSSISPQDIDHYEPHTRRRPASPKPTYQPGFCPEFEHHFT
ncbi:zinc knuckle [Cooperia oncophora]